MKKKTRNAREGVAETMRNNGGRAERSDKEEGEKGIYLSFWGKIWVFLGGFVQGEGGAGRGKGISRVV